MPKTQKQKLIGILILACILMMILSISLSALKMQPGQVFSPQFAGQSTSSESQDFGEISWFFVAIRGFQIILLILLPIYIVINLLSNEGRRKLFLDILKIAILFLIAMWISDFGQRMTPSEEITGQQPGSIDFCAISGAGIAPPSFEANPQSWMLTLIIFVGAALIAVITFFGLKFLVKPKRSDNLQLDEFAAKAQTALDDIKAAKIDFDDVIIRCYAEMSQILQDEKDIQRKQAMTTQEFGRELLTKGFPTQPVQQLTQLFEQVRYGRRQPGDDAQLTATVSLREIIDFCRGQA